MPSFGGLFRMLTPLVCNARCMLFCKCFKTAVDSSVKASLLSWLPEALVKETMDVDDVSTTKSSAEPVPEVQIYLQLLLIHHLLTNSETYPKAMALVQETIVKMQALNRRSMDPIAAKVWYVVERTYELVGDLAEARQYVRSHSFYSIQLTACQFIPRCSEDRFPPSRRRNAGVTNQSIASQLPSLQSVRPSRQTCVKDHVPNFRE